MLRVFTGDLKEVVFQGAIDPHTPIAQGWLRASHRKLDKKLSLPYRPYHTHDKKQPLTKGKPVELDIEIWPTSIAVPAGYRIGLSVRGKDYEYGGASGGKLSNFKNELTGCGPFLHNDPRDRPPAVFNGTTTLHFSGGKAAYLLLPIIPPKKKAAGKKRGRRKSVLPLVPATAYARFASYGEVRRIRSAVESGDPVLTLRTRLIPARRNDGKQASRPNRVFISIEPRVRFAQPSN